MTVPKLRFKEYNSDWKKVKLNEITTRIGDGLHSTPEYDEEGSIYFANGSNIKDGVLVFDENTKTINEEEFTKYKFLLNKNSILVALNGATWGRFGLYHGEKILLGKSLGYINISESHSKNFMYYQLQLKKIRRFFESEITGSTIKNLSLQTLRNTEVNIPTLDEQDKIASFLIVLEQKIQLQQEKIDLIKEQKKGFMQKIFNHELRLKDNNGQFFPEWKEVKLSEILKERKTFEKKDMSYPHVSLTINGLEYKSERYNRDFLVKDDNKKYKITKMHDICYNPANLKFGVLAINTLGDAIFSPIYVTFEVSSFYSPHYLYLYLKYSSFINKIRKYEEGTVYERMAVKPEDFVKHSAKFPSLKEQEAISNFFLLFDKKIAIEEQKLDQLDYQKQAFMQQMFI